MGKLFLPLMAYLLVVSGIIGWLGPRYTWWHAIAGIAFGGVIFLAAAYWATRLNRG